MSSTRCNQCQTIITTSKFLTHLANKCPERLIECDTCYKITPHKIWIGTHGKECDDYKARCKFCGTRFLNTEMCEHLSNCSATLEIFDETYRHSLGTPQFVQVAKYIRQLRRNMITGAKTGDYMNELDAYVMDGCTMDILLCLRQFFHEPLLNEATLLLRYVKFGWKFFLKCKSILGDEVTTAFMNQMMRWTRMDHHDTYCKIETEDYNGFTLMRYWMNIENQQVFYDVINNKKCARMLVASLRATFCECLNVNLPNVVLRYLFDEYLLNV